MTSPPSGTVDSGRPAGLGPPRVDDISVGELIGDLTPLAEVELVNQLNLGRPATNVKLVDRCQLMHMMPAYAPPGLVTYLTAPHRVTQV